MEDTNKIVLGRTVVEQAVEEKKVALPAVKLSFIVMDVSWSLWMGDARSIGATFVLI
jgi:hypothetical protein